MRIIYFLILNDFFNYTRKPHIVGLTKFAKVVVYEYQRKYILPYPFLKKIKSNIENLDLYRIYNPFPRKILRKFKIINSINRNFYQKLDVQQEGDVHVYVNPSQDLIPEYYSRPYYFELSDPFSLMAKDKRMAIECERKMIGDATGVFATALELAKAYSSYSDKIHYVPNTYDSEVFDYCKHEKLETKIANNRKTIGYIGNINEYVIDLELLDELTVTFKNCDFLFIGKINGSRKFMLKKLYKRIFNRSNVKFIGWVPYPKLPAYINSFSACILLDKRDDFSKFIHHNKTYQYLALGKPVVTLDTMPDWNNFNNIFVANSHAEYIQLLKIALEPAKKRQIEARIKEAKRNDHFSRAKEKIDIILQDSTDCKI